jgi:hypothetical protein
MVSPEKLAERLYGGKWKVSLPEDKIEDIEKARKQGAVEEQKKELVFLNKLQERLNGYHCGYHEQLNKMINNRKKELNEGDLK